MAALTGTPLEVIAGEDEGEEEAKEVEMTRGGGPVNRSEDDDDVSSGRLLRVRGDREEEEDESVLMNCLFLCGSVISTGLFCGSLE